MSLFLVFGLFTTQQSWGQIVLIDPLTGGGFENATATPAANGWSATTSTNTGINQWVVNTDTKYAGDNSAYITNNTATVQPPNIYDKNNARVSHLYQNFTIPTTASSATLSFYWKCTGEGTTTPYDYLRCYFEPATNTAPIYETQKNFTGTAPNGIVNAATAGTAPTTSTYYNISQSGHTGYQLVTITIPAEYFTNTAYRLTFEWKNDADTKNNPPASIDNVSLTYVAQTPCSGTPAPGNTIASVNSVVSGGTSVLSLQNTTAGSGVTYQWQSSTNNSTFANIVGATASTYTATVTAKTYYRCLVTCSGATGTATSVLVSLSYCASTYTNGSGTADQITNVTLGLLSNTSGASASPYYTFYNALTIPNLQQSSTASIAVTVGSDGSQYVGVWIDFNQDFIFQATEGVISGNLGASGTTTLSLAVPIGAILGNTRMRVRGGNDSALTTVQSCGASSSGFGETEDYIVNIITLTPPAITSFTPTSGCVGSSITITGTNFTGATAVTIGNTAVSSITSITATQIIAVVGSGTIGTVKVTTPGGIGTSSSTFTVNASPIVNPITGASSVCAGNSITLADTTSGGVWSVTNGTGTASITSLGVLTGTTAGTVTVVYTVTASGCSTPVSFPVTISPVPSITTQPGAVSVALGGNTAFSVVASGSPTSYSWQVSTNGATSWSTINNGGVYSTATTASLTITGATSSMDGYQYKATATNGCGSTVSSSGTLNIVTAGCVNTTKYPTATINAPTNNVLLIITDSQLLGQYNAINVTVPSTFISTYNRRNESFITVRSGTFNGPIVTSGVSPLTWTATSPGLYYVHYNTNSCGSNTNTKTSTIQCITCDPISAVPNAQDCLGAIAVCNTSYSTTNSYSGTGNISNEINTSNSCLASGEKNDVWYSFTVINSGNLIFTITPNQSTDDYDWAIYNLTNASCSDIYSNPALMISCNYSADTGNTGLSSSGNTNNQTSIGTAFNSSIQVTAGQTYVVNISNFSSTQNGYDLNFGTSSATIYDNVVPSIQSVVQPIVCGATSLGFNFSETVLCSSVANSLFSLTGPGGPYTLSGVSGPGCSIGGAQEKDFTINVSPALTVAGNYTLNYNGGIKDLCNNVAPSSFINFTITNGITANAGLNQSVCAGNNITLTGSATGGSTYTYSWSPTAGLSNPNSNITTISNPSNSSASSTQYTLTATSAGCNAVATTTIIVAVTLAAPGAITGGASQCPSTTSLTYSIAAVSGATSYNWTIPTGWSITAGQGTISIAVTSGSSSQNGNITVTATNSCGTSSASSLAVTLASVPPPTAVAQTFCSSATVANLVATGTAIKWYAALTGGTALASTTALVSGTTYYASQTVGTCESTRTAVVVTITTSSINYGAISSTLNHIVISQIYGGGGLPAFTGPPFVAAATFKNDFVELYNSTSVAVSLNGYSLQYASDLGNTWSYKINLPSVSIASGSYYLIQLHSAGSEGSNLPSPDFVATIDLANDSGKIALMNNTTTNPNGICPPNDSSTIDFVGYGNANCSEGNAAAPKLTRILADFRNGNGNLDTNVNATDFTAGTPNPHNSTTTLAPQTNQIFCGSGTPASMEVTGASGSSLTYQWYSQTGIISAPSGSSTSGWTSISGAISTIYTPTAPITTSTTYACFVTSSCGSNWASGVRQITINQPPITTPIYHE